MFCLGPAEYGDSDVSGRTHIGGVIGYEKPRLKDPKSTTPGPGAYDVRNVGRRFCLPCMVVGV